MPVDLNKLKTFYTLAKAGSYTGCAQRLCLTQSAVSHAIKKLEADLGYDLVDRSGRKFRLTREGEFLFQQCAGIFDRIDDTLDRLAVGKGHRISLTLGAPAEFGSSILIKGMAPFRNVIPTSTLIFSWIRICWSRCFQMPWISLWTASLMCMKAWCACR
ncbi:MAG: LysR family transcriptional regulator [Desulfotignum sp.]|nr:LysR family transcriptional regulator [Desulfotignum sp.]